MSKKIADLKNAFGFSSIELSQMKKTSDFAGHFETEMFKVVVSKYKGRKCRSDATIKIKVGKNSEITSAEGSGPVDALDNAFRKAIVRFFPAFNNLKLSGFKVNDIDGESGTGAIVCVQMEWEIRGIIIYTAGISDDIIEASWQALHDSYQYVLFLG